MKVATVSCAGETVIRDATPEEIERLKASWALPPIGAYAAAIQAHVDDVAKARGYADGAALAGYASSTIPAWAAEAKVFIAWRDQVWLQSYGELAKVQTGERQQPAIDDLIAELPKIDWLA